MAGDRVGDFDTPDALILSGPLYALSQRGPIGSGWVARRWIAGVRAAYEDAGLDRGKRGARRGAVQHLILRRGAAQGQVIDLGARAREAEDASRVTHTTILHVAELDAERWWALLEALAPDEREAVQRGELPERVEQACQQLGFSLFPASAAEIAFDCSCLEVSEYGLPVCKHAAALCWLLAERFDSDPLALLHLRGQPRDGWMARLEQLARRSEMPLAPNSPPAAFIDQRDLAGFWAMAGPLPDMPDTPDPANILETLGEPPGQIGAALRRIYQTVRDQARAARTARPAQDGSKS